MLGFLLLVFFFNMYICSYSYFQFGHWRFTMILMLFTITMCVYIINHGYLKGPQYKAQEGDEGSQLINIKQSLLKPNIYQWPDFRYKKNMKNPIQMKIRSNIIIMWCLSVISNEVQVKAFYTWQNWFKYSCRLMHHRAKQIYMYHTW